MTRVTKRVYGKDAPRSHWALTILGNRVLLNKRTSPTKLWNLDAKRAERVYRLLDRAERILWKAEKQRRTV